MNIKKIFSFLIVTSIFLYLAYRLTKTWNQLKYMDFNFNYFYLILAIIIFCIFYVLEGIGYLIFIRFVKSKAPIKAVLKARYVSDLGRYLPGKVWTYLGRIYILKKYNITKTQVLISSTLEMALMILGAITIFFTSLFFWDANLKQFNYLLILILVCMLIIIHPKILNYLIKIGEKILKKEVAKINIKYNILILMILFYCFYWIVYGFGAYILINSLTILSLTKLPIIIAIFAISWVLGFLSFLAPAGLGVRDGLLTFFLIYIVTEPIAIIVVLTARIVLTIIESIYALISLKVKV